MKRIIKFSFVVAALFLTGTLNATLTASKLQAARPTIVHNGTKGLWEGDPSKHFNLITDLVIGTEDGDDNEIFGRVYDIAVDSEGSIYVLDNSFPRVQKYDDRGSYQLTIGRAGQGPGECSFPTAMALDELNYIYVADQGRVNVYDIGGNYLAQLTHGLSSGFIHSLAVATSEEIYISCFEIFEQRVLHKFSLERGILFSFCDSYAVGQDIDVRIESAYSGGQVDIDDRGAVYYAQMTPYEIRKFNPNGELLTIIHRENDFLQPKVEIKGDVFQLGRFTGSSSIVILEDGRLINVLKTPPLPDEPDETIFDVFDEEGRLLISRRFSRNIDVKCRDDAGKLYGIDLEGYPKVVRYRDAFE